MTDITDKIAALPPMPENDWGDAKHVDKRFPVLLDYVVGERRAILARLDLALEVLRDLLPAVKVLHGQGPDCIIPTTVNTPIGVAIKLATIVSDCEAVLAACGEGEG